MIIQSNTLDYLFLQDGKDGIPGNNGDNGKTLYTWVKYSDSPDGSNMTDNSENALYIGIAYNKESQTESDDKTQYSWSKIRGNDGQNGTDAYTIILQNENISFSTNQSRVPLSNQSHSCEVIVMKGSNIITNYTIGSINSVTGINVLVSNNVITLSASTSTAIASDVGSIIVPIIINDRTFNKVISFSTSKEGITGKSGVSVTSVDIEYYLSSSPTTLSDGSWQTEVPIWENGKYIWSKTVTTLSNNTSTETSPVCITGSKGTDGTKGEKGDTGTGIASITEEYAITKNKDTTPTEWITSVPEWNMGEYIWTRNKIVYQNPTSTVYTTPICDTSWEAANNVQADLNNLKQEIKTTISGVESKVNKNTKSITEKIWQTDIATEINIYDDTTTKAIRDRVTKNEANINGIKTNISDLTTEVAGKADNSEITSLTQKVAKIENTAEGLKSEVSAVTITANNANTKASNLQQTGLSWKVNYNDFTTSNNGKLYLHGLDNDTGASSDVNGWIIWNGVKIVIPKTTINPNDVCPYNTPIYVVRRISGTAATYLVWFDTEGKWKYSITPTPTMVSGTWTWDNSNDIILGSFVESSSENVITSAQIYTPALSYTNITTSPEIKSLIQQTSDAIASTVSKTFATKEETSKNLKSVEVQYALSNSPTTAPTTDWNTKAPEWQHGMYMWQKTITTFADGSLSESEPTNISGATGQQGTQGINLYTGTKNFIGDNWENLSNWTTTEEKYEGLTVKKRKDTWGGISQNLNVKAGETYTISVYAKADTDDCEMHFTTGTTTTGITQKETVVINVGKKWNRYSAVYKIIKDGIIKLRIEKSQADDIYTYICGYKVEKGEVQETVWTPAMEDLRGEKGDKGDSGAEGADGRGIKNVIAQYYLSTSDKILPDNNSDLWSETQPEYISNPKHYYWTRDYITWTDNSTTTTTPVLATGLNNANDKASTAYSKAIQTAEGFSWLVASDYGESNVRLSDDAYRVISNNITLTGDIIALNGTTTIGKDFTLKADNIEAGTLSADITATNLKILNGKIQINAIETNETIAEDRIFLTLSYEDDIGNINTTGISSSGIWSTSYSMDNGKSELGIRSGAITLINSNDTGFELYNQDNGTYMNAQYATFKSVIVSKNWQNGPTNHGYTFEVEGNTYIEDIAHIHGGIFTGDKRSMSDTAFPGAFISNYGAIHLTRTDGQNPYINLNKDDAGCSISYDGTNLKFSKPITAPNLGTYQSANGTQKSISSGTSTTNTQSLSLVAGVWIVQFWATWSGNATGRRHINIANSSGSSSSNGSVSTINYPSGTGSYPQSKVVILNVSSTTTFYINAGQNSGSTLTCTTGYRAVRIK